jgi:hypothetical protein
MTTVSEGSTRSTAKAILAHPPIPSFPHVCVCGRTYTAAGWANLPLVGRMDKDEDGDQKLELRNCRCRSTRAVETGHESINARTWELLRAMTEEECARTEAAGRGVGPTGPKDHGTMGPKDQSTSVTLADASPAEKGCYGCLGTGTLQGFGAAGGTKCPCVATCEDCCEPFAWAHDDERAPSHCAACFATALEGAEGGAR